MTIFGVSAGGSSVNALLAAPSADGLYHRAIAHSGTAITNAPEPQAPGLSEHLQVDEKELLPRLMQLPSGRVAGRAAPLRGQGRCQR